jgi:hypothetical protein
MATPIDEVSTATNVSRHADLPTMPSITTRIARDTGTCHGAVSPDRGEPRPQWAQPQRLTDAVRKVMS